MVQKYDLPYYGIDIDAQFHPGTLGLKEEDELSQATQEKKPAAKRKRENRYKNAAPAVLSVCYQRPIPPSRSG